MTTRDQRSTCLREQGYELSAMASSDHAEVIALWQATPGMSRLETQAELTRFLERNPGLSQVVRCHGTLVAAVLAGHDGRRGYLYHLAVAADHQRRGLATWVVDRCLALMAEQGLPRCGLQVYVDNDSGLEFWRRSGWTERMDVRPFTRDL
jgi:ribosomal protein S18 acetylase RimI-like enzyme